jgi:sigma-B regulation protein RsbU (phosphoserine phosphatase)
MLIRQPSDPPLEPPWPSVLSFADRLLDHVEAAIIATDLRGRILYANRYASALYGWPLADLIGVDSTIFAAEATGQELAGEIAQALQESRSWSGDFRLRRPDGTLITVRASDSGIFDERGGLVGVVSVSIDVTERRAIEHALAVSELRKSAMLAASLDAVVSIDATGSVIEWNPAAEAMFGYRPEEVLGRPMAELIIPPTWRERHNEGFQRYLATGEGTMIGRRVEVRAQRRGGTEFPVEIAINSIDLPDEVAFVASISDITNRRRAEQALVESREDFAHLAQTLQASLLPPELPYVPGLDLAAHYRPAGDGSEVGGDFYDIFEIRPGEWALMIGDVEGKGPAAATLTALVRYTARAAAMKSRKPSVILSAVNEAVRHHPGEQFATMAYARLRRVSGCFRMAIASGGHPLPLLGRQGQVEEVGRPGTLLGAFAEPRFPTREVDLQPGDSVVFFTDGVTEARAPTGLWGEERLQASFENALGADAATIADGIAELVVDYQSGRPADDVALLVLNVASSPRGEEQLPVEDDQIGDRR